MHIFLRDREEWGRPLWQEFWLKALIVLSPTITPCNKCHNCVEIAAGISADVIEIDGASKGVDDIQELQRELLYAPSQSSYKIYIIDEVHMLSKMPSMLFENIGRASRQCYLYLCYY